MSEVEAATRPTVSVVIVSDYAVGSETARRELFDVLRSLAQQDFEEPVEFVLCENDTMPDADASEMAPLLPGLKVLRSSATSSYALKNDAVQFASGELVAVIDADVIPARDWLRQSVQALRAHPEVAVVSGRSFHRASGFVPRALALIERGFMDPGKSGVTRYIGNHACLYRRDVFLAHPLHVTGGPFTSRLQSEAVLRAGKKLFFESAAEVFHVYDGWEVQADIARNAGYGTIVTRLIDRAQPFAWLTRLGMASIPIFVAGKTLNTLADCLRCYRQYGIEVYELPALLALAIVTRVLEVPGMWYALRGRPLSATAYR